MQKRVLLITGQPGIGKTTALTRIVQALNQQGHKVGGMITREVRSSGIRVGFQILDIDSGQTGWLAHIHQQKGPKIGKYVVNLSDLNQIGVKAITNAMKDQDIIAIDEIGPMELLSKEFTDAVRKTAESPKPLISVIHWKARDKLIDQIKARKDAQTYVITAENRDILPQTVIEKAQELLSTTTTTQTVLAPKPNSREKSET